jgi:transketolase
MEMREVFAKKLIELSQKDDRIIVLDADLNTSTKTDLFKEVYPARFIQCGIAEQNMFGWAAGLATLGYIPFPSTFAAFAVTRSADQINLSIAYPKLNVKIPGSYCGISTGKAGATHQTVQDLAIMRSMPNMRVLDAADSEELRQMMDAMIAMDGPVYFRILRPEIPMVFGNTYRFDWKPVLIRDGRDLTLIGTGLMTARNIEAARELSNRGIDAAVLHVPCLKPLDSGLILEYAARTGRIVTAENHSIIGGLGSAVAEIVSERMPIIIKRVGVDDLFVETGDDNEIYEKYGLTVRHVIDKAVEAYSPH